MRASSVFFSSQPVTIVLAGNTNAKPQTNATTTMPINIVRTRSLSQYSHICHPDGGDAAWAAAA